MKKLITLSLFTIALISCNEKFNPKIDTPYTITIDGNSYITENKCSIEIDENGINSWSGDSQFSLFFKPEKAGELVLAMVAKNDSGKSSININVNEETFDVEINENKNDTIYIGRVDVNSNDYLEVKFSADTKEGGVYADIKELLIGGDAAGNEMTYVKDFSTYWGRRGPSVHMAYELPENVDTEYFYNEVTVPEGNDIIGSYYMANGFAEGYFGMQANSDTERRVLFSVWSPFDTQDPKLIPEEDRIVCLRRGEGVHIGEFGNEGSGGQSYLKYMWKAGETYKFLTKITPDTKGATIYTAYFYATDESRWRLIASFKRPKTDTYYKRPHSFLENFIPNQGYISREVEFFNQWALDKNGKWHEITNGSFTFDATANAGVRLDYAGGVNSEKSAFYLKNCGFFNENTSYKTEFERNKNQKPPQIDFEILENL